MASGYDITIKLYQHHVIERYVYACCGHRPDATNVVLDVFCSCYTVISAAGHQLLYHVNNLLARVCKHINDSATTPHHTTPKSFASQL